MARDFNGSSDYLKHAAPVLSAPPLSMFCWFNSTTTAATQNVMVLSNATYYPNTGARAWQIQLNSPSGIRAYSIKDSTGHNAQIAGSWATGSWQYIAGTWNSTDTVRKVYYGGSSASHSATGFTSATLTKTLISVGPAESASFVSGKIAEAAIWNVELSAAEIAKLAAGYSPLFVQPDNLVAYWPLLGYSSPELDRIGGYNLTLTGTTVADHPRIIYPSRPKYFLPLAAAAVTQITALSPLGTPGKPYAFVAKSGSSSVTETAGLGTGSGTGLQATITVSDNISLETGIGTGSGTGLQATDSLGVSITAGLGTGTGTGLLSTFSSNLSLIAGLGTGSGAGQQITVVGATVNTQVKVDWPTGFTNLLYSLDGGATWQAYTDNTYVTLDVVLDAEVLMKGTVPGTPAASYDIDVYAKSDDYTEETVQLSVTREAGVVLTAGLGTGSGTGLQATVTVSDNISLEAGIGTGTGTGLQATVTVSDNISLEAGIGTGTGTGLQATVTATSSNGYNETAGVGTGSGTGLQTTVTLGQNITAGLGTGSGTGLLATETIGSGVSLIAGLGAGSGTGLLATATIGSGVSLIAGLGAGSGTGLLATATITSSTGFSVTAGRGTGTGTGLQPLLGIGQSNSAGLGLGNGIGLQPAIELDHFLISGIGAATGGGLIPTVTASVHCETATGTGLGAGLNPSTTAYYDVILATGAGTGFGTGLSPELILVLRLTPTLVFESSEYYERGPVTITLTFDGADTSDVLVRCTFPEVVGQLQWFDGVVWLDYTNDTFVLHPVSPIIGQDSTVKFRGTVLTEPPDMLVFQVSTKSDTDEILTQTDQKTGTRKLPSTFDLSADIL